MTYKVGIRLYMEFEHNRRLLEGILKECDGAIVQIYEKPLAKTVNALRIPVISVVNSTFTLDLPSVINDDAAIGRMAAGIPAGIELPLVRFCRFLLPARVVARERTRVCRAAGKIRVSIKHLVI